MKIWKFYLIPEKNDVDKNYKLYAITNNKDYYNQFKSERNMNKFIAADPVELDEVDGVEFINENMKYLLSYNKYDTKTEINGVYKIDTVTILSTDEEHKLSTDGDMIEEYINQTLLEACRTSVSYRCFKKIFIKALKKVEFIPFYKLFSTDPVMDGKDDDYSCPDINYDELGIFIRLYSNLFDNSEKKQSI